MAYGEDKIEPSNYQNIIVAYLATDLLNNVKKSVQAQTQQQPAATKPTDTPPTAANASATSTETPSLRQPGESVKNCAIRLGGNTQKNRAMCRSGGGQKQAEVTKQTPQPANVSASASKGRLPGESVNDCMARLESNRGRNMKKSKGNNAICRPYSERPDGTYN